MHRRRERDTNIRAIHKGRYHLTLQVAPIKLYRFRGLMISVATYFERSEITPQSLRDSYFQKEPKIISNRGKANLRGRSIKSTELSAIVASLEKEVARRSRDGGLIYQSAFRLRHTSSVRRPYTFSSGRRRNCFGPDPLGFMLGRSDSVSFINY